MEPIFHQSSRSPRAECLVNTFVVLCLLLLGARDAVGQSHLWSRGFGDASGGGSCRSVALGGLGNVVVTGNFSGTVDFGGGPLMSAGKKDIFVVKFDGDGNHLWSQRFGDASDQWGMSVAVDGSGNVIATGYFRGSLDFGGAPLTSAGYEDIFVAKFDPSGNLLWSQRFGDAKSQWGNSASVDDSGNVIVTGTFYGTVDFGGGPLTSAGNHDIYDIFVVKFDGDGNHLWSQRFGDPDWEGCWSVALDGSGNVILTGYIDGSVDFGGGPLTSAGYADIFVAKFDGGGNHLWSQRFGDVNDQYGESVAVDGSGNVIVTGQFLDTVDFGGGLLTSGGGVDIFVAKFDPGGDHIWSQRFGDAGGQIGESVAVDGLGNVVVTGDFWDGTVDFGGGPLTSAGNKDIFLAKFDPNGNHVWSQRFGDVSAQDSDCVAVDGSGDVVVTGSFSGTVDFGGGPLTGGGSFVAKFGDLNVPVAIGSFDARAFDGGVALYSSFTSSRRVLGVNIYRAEDSGRLLLYEKVLHSGNEFYYEDPDIEPGRTYHYRIGVVDQDGEFFSQIATVKAGGYDTVLLPNVPNPFNPETTIRFTLEKAVHVTLAIYNVNGKRVTSLIDDMRAVGPHEARWDGTDAAGAPVSSGVYFCRMSAGKTNLSRRMVLLK